MIKVVPNRSGYQSGYQFANAVVYVLLLFYSLPLILLLLQLTYMIPRIYLHIVYYSVVYFYHYL